MAADEKLLLIDEVLTPDSSRFWPQEDYRPGGPQKSYDKQYLRDYLESLGWNKQPPPPPLPADVIANTRARYLQALAEPSPAKSWVESRACLVHPAPRCPPGQQGAEAG